ncbi:MAG TPA: hypothetical protein VHC43_02320 [Mycobacteriales bacterium]|nr:hypothetical protein [Mycobacteriales bacterium]
MTATSHAREPRHFTTRSAFVAAAALAAATLLPLVSSNPATAANAVSCNAWTRVAGVGTGSTWSALDGVDARTGSDVWAVGHIGNPSAPLIEHWNGSKWKRVHAANPYAGRSYTGSARLTDVDAVSRHDAWAVGLASSKSGRLHTLVEHWNGKKWSIVPSPDMSSATSTLSTLRRVAAVSSTDAWAIGVWTPRLATDGIGRGLIEHWNGKQWSIVDGPEPGSFSDLDGIAARSATDIWVAGWYLDDGGNSDAMAEHWDGQQWTLQAPLQPDAVNNAFNAIAPMPGGGLMAVGDRYFDGVAPTRALTESWDGQQWTVGEPEQPGSVTELDGVAAFGSGSALAVGVTRDSTGVDRTLAQRWDGTSWTVETSPSRGSSPSQLTDVSALQSGRAWAVGSAVLSDDPGNQRLLLLTRC